LPNDVTGVSVFRQGTGQFEFRPGPVFTNLLLADEINRATPRTQAALLEAMQERTVTVDGVTHSLSRPFLVLATQNPVEYEGTFPLPEAQLDRFLLRFAVGYPNAADEARVLRTLQRRHPIETLGAVATVDDVLTAHPQVWEVHVDEIIVEYITQLVRATRDHRDVALGASPRGSLALFKSAQAWAALHGRDYVVPDDVKRLAPSALPHRILVRPESGLRGRTAANIVAEVLAATPAPVGEAL
jgi:MoxR-like ATPase